MKIFLGAVLAPDERDALGAQLAVVEERLGEASSALALASLNLTASQKAAFSTRLDALLERQLRLSDAVAGQDVFTDAPTAGAELARLEQEASAYLSEVSRAARLGAAAVPWRYLFWGGLAVVTAGVVGAWVMRRGPIWGRKRFRGYRMMRRRRR